MRAHERLDLRVRVPLFPVYLIASDMKTLIEKKLGHFADEFIEKMVSMLFCWIHGWIKHSPFALNSIRPGRAGEVGIADNPGGTVQATRRYPRYVVDTDGRRGESCCSGLD